MANGRESRRPVRLLSSSPSSLRRSLVFFFILRRPRYTSGERLQTRSSRTVAGKVWRHLLLCKIPPFLSLFFFFLFRVSRRILLERRREIFLSLRFGWKNRNYVAILCEIQLLSIIGSYFGIYSYVLVWFYPEEDNSIRRVVST